MRDIRRLTRFTNLLIISTILIVLVVLMMLMQPEFFQGQPKRDLSIYTEQANGWHQIELGAFSVNTPSDYLYVEQQGIDSYVGLITNSEDSIYFDYGWYSSNFDEPIFINSHDTINGVPARVALKNDQIVGTYFHNVKGENKLSIYSWDWNNEISTRILASIKFPGRSGNTTIKIGNNISDSIESGHRLFATNCVVCHRLYEIRIGPPLFGVIERTSRDWFINWVLNSEEFIQENEQAAKLFEEYGNTKHPEFPFTDQQLGDLIKFIESHE